VYRFYDAFLFPIDDRTPPLSTPLEVSIPSLQWAALRVDGDCTYRFSALTLTKPAPTGANLPVHVVAPAGDYVSFEPILLTLPLPVATPPTRANYLITRPLWPTPVVRPPIGETAVRGHLRSASALPVANLKVQVWTGGSPTPPAGTPFTRSNEHGDFLVRFPRLKGTPGQTEVVGIQLSDGAVGVTPASLSIVLGQTQVVEFLRT
jgi:hypothetical protein